MSKNAKPAVSSTVESVVLRTLEELSERGWCVVLKKLPPKIGWLIEGSRSEYDAPCPDKRVLPDTWACEATFIGQTNRWMFEQCAFSKSPQEAVARVAELCAGEESRTGRDTQNVSGQPRLAQETT
jgi:hypothetical protein